MNLADFRLALGPALWLLNLYHLNATGDPTAEGYFICCAGQPLSDSEMAFHLGVAERTVCGWRRRLERVGLIKSEPAENRCRRIWVRSLWVVFSSAGKVESETQPVTTATAAQSSDAKSWVQ
jgi:hypothetical protein